jgi:hypothetical protein
LAPGSARAVPDIAMPEGKAHRAASGNVPAGGPVMGDPFSFEIDCLSVVSCTDHYGQRSFAHGMVSVGPFRISVYLRGDGDVVLPSSLRDRRLHFAISKAFRAATLAKFAETLAGRDEWETAELEGPEAVEALRQRFRRERGNGAETAR